ncbi:MAG: hypothetical protein ABI595_11970 [Actinomycetota bacterium]
MEPIHYLRAFRRRWWVIAAAVLVAGGVAWATTQVSPASTSLTSESQGRAGYTATTVIWNPGTFVGGGGTIFSMDQLAQVVTLPDVATIAAKDLGYTGDLLALGAQVQASADPTTGFLRVTATADGPKGAEAISTAFSRGLIAYLQRLKITQADQQQRLLQKEITALQKHFAADPTVIASLQAALSQLAVNRAAPISLLVIQPPRATQIPDAPTSGFQAPKSGWSRVLLACLFGLLAGMALVLVLERFDTRLRSSRAAEEAFGYPVLAEVPAISRRRRDGVVTASHPSSRAADAFRLVAVGTARWTHANGNGRSNGHDATTILVTSPEARDGKTTVAANLAVAYAQKGSRVLVVSCDLRRPSIHEAFGVAQEPGLVDLLGSTNGNADPGKPLDLAPYLEPCSVVRVAVLPSGATAMYPGELLGSPEMEGFVGRLKKITDVIILDCAPLVVAGDVMPLLHQADGVVLVARAGKTRQELATNTATLLQRQGVTEAGVVLNDAREFSIPLAKRRMYRPTRKMRRAAQRNPQPSVDAMWTLDSTILEPPVVEPPVVEPPVVEPPVVEPPVVEPPVVEEPEISVETPDAGDDEGRNGSGRRVVQVPSVDDAQPELQPRSAKIETLQRELVELRSNLEGLQLELPDLSHHEIETTTDPVRRNDLG